jgi:hypothetical protein
MRLGSGAEVAELALAGGGGEEAKGHGESVTGGGLWAGRQVSRSASQRVS